MANFGLLTCLTQNFTGTELEVVQTETGEYVHIFKTAQPVPVVAWAPTRYFLAYAEMGSLRIVGVDTDRKR